MPRRAGLSAPAARGFARMLSPGADAKFPTAGPRPGTPPGPGGPAEAERLDMAREIRSIWPGLAPANSVPFDLRRLQIGIGAGWTTILRYTMPAQTEGPIKQYGVGLWPTSLVPGPAGVWLYQMRVNDSVITPDEALGGWFSIPSPSPRDTDLDDLTYMLTGNDVLTVLVNNTSGIVLDLWVRVKGWRYQAKAKGGGV